MLRRFKPGFHLSLPSSCPFLISFTYRTACPFPWHKGFHSYKIVCKSLTNPNFIDEGTGRIPQFLDSRSDRERNRDKKTPFNTRNFQFVFQCYNPCCVIIILFFHPGPILTSELVIDLSVFRCGNINHLQKECQYLDGKPQSHCCGKEVGILAWMFAILFNYLCAVPFYSNSSYSIHNSHYKVR